MRYMLSELSCQKKMFVGDFDSYTVKKHDFSFEYLYHLAKISMLLYDRIILPAAFFWQEEKMQRLLLHLQPAIECGLILPAIRDFNDTRDIQDYFDLRTEEGKKIDQLSISLRPELACEIPSASGFRFVMPLKEANTFVHVDRGSVRKKYIENWCCDLDNTTDINTLRLLLAQGNYSPEELYQINNIFRKHTEEQVFSRATCINLAEKILIPGRVRNLVFERISWLYLKSNADVYGSGMFYSKNPYNGMIFEDNLLLLEKTLNILGITYQVIDTLSVEDVITIRMSEEYRHFIALYRGIIHPFSQEQDEIVKTIEKKLKHEVHKEKFNKGFCEAIKTIQGLSSDIFVGILGNILMNGSIPTEVFTSTGIMAGTSFMIKRISLANNLFESMAFVKFKDYIDNKEYTNRIINATRKFI